MFRSPKKHEEQASRQRWFTRSQMSVVACKQIDRTNSYGSLNDVGGGKGEPSEGPAASLVLPAILQRCASFDLAVSFSLSSLSGKISLVVQLPLMEAKKNSNREEAPNPDQDPIKITPNSPENRRSESGENRSKKFYLPPSFATSRNNKKEASMMRTAFPQQIPKRGNSKATNPQIPQPKVPLTRRWGNSR